MPMFILNNLTWFWLAVVIVCVIIESLTFALTTIWFGCGAVVMIFLSLTPLPFKWQLLIFVTISLVLLIFTRPLVAKKLAKRVPTNADGLIGKKALVTQKITDLDKGAIKVNGVIWTAKAENDSDIAEGVECRIVRLEGNTAIVAVE
ncbi:MAG: NfeD family protein [Treponema sp.]|nr:NfeD family protein [Treponema sp.]